MEFLVAAYTDSGLQGEINQDSFCIRHAFVPNIGEIVMAAVCDGMGGLKKGEVASAAAIASLGAWFDQKLNMLPVLCNPDFARVQSQWTDLVKSLHLELKGYTAKTGEQLGTTVTAFLTFGDRFLTMNIGDSRIYEQKQNLRQLTQDQSLIAREIANGVLTEEEGKHHPQRNVLLQCLGAGEQVIPDFTRGKIQTNALYLLCSDGLVHEITLDELASHLPFFYLNSKESMTEALHVLTEICKERGETDNITAVLIRAQESNCMEQSEKGLKKIAQAIHLIPAKDDIHPKKITLLETAQVMHDQEAKSRA